MNTNRQTGGRQMKNPRAAMSDAPGTHPPLCSDSHCPARSIGGEVAHHVRDQLCRLRRVKADRSPFANLDEDGVRHRLSGNVVEVRGERRSDAARIHRDEAGNLWISRGDVERHRASSGRHATSTDDDD